jgi:anti-anti-sigma factor
MTETSIFTCTNSGGTARVALFGEIDMAVADSLSQPIITAVAGVPSVTIDLSRVEFLDSAGLRMIQTVVRSVAASRREVSLVAPPHSPARRLFQLTGLDGVVPILDA